MCFIVNVQQFILIYCSYDSILIPGPDKGKGIASQGWIKEGLGGTKALTDISNSEKPAPLQPSKKHNSANVISIVDDVCLSKTKQSVVRKKSLPKSLWKSQVGGRKALSDLTNANKPYVHVVKKSPSKNLIAIVEKEHSSRKGFSAQSSKFHCISKALSIPPAKHLTFLFSHPFEDDLQ